ncbi:hypothetical protein [Corynebacterium mayonis]|uniref:hypothetical protein n=1 Tax=Corynebacterium mayonis TaxID=3062461 RepID=UPI0031402969
MGTISRPLSIALAAGVALSPGLVSAGAQALPPQNHSLSSVNPLSSVITGLPS